MDQPKTAPPAHKETETKSAEELSFRQKFIRGTLWLVALLFAAAVGFSYLLSGGISLPQTGSTVSTFVSRGANLFSTPRTSATCPGTRYVVTLMPSWFEFNPGGACRTVVEVTSGNYENADALGAFPRASVERRTALWVRALTPTAQIEYSLCPKELPEPKLQLGCLPDS